MKLSKTLVIPLATVALVIVGTGAVLATTAPGAPTVVGSVVPAVATPSAAPGASAAPVAPYLSSVLDGMVAKGTITAAQEQAIVAAWVAKRDELKAERQQLRSFLADGVLTANELAQLPADSPFQQLKPLVTDGQISVAQLRALGRGILNELRIGRAPGAAAGRATPTASPATGG